MWTHGRVDNVIQTGDVRLFLQPCLSGCQLYEAQASAKQFLEVLSIISFTLVSSFDPLHVLDLLKTSKTKLPLQYTSPIYYM
jgi:hypothetical protein